MPTVGLALQSSHNALVAIVQSGGEGADAAATALIDAYSPLIWSHCAKVPKTLRKDAYSVGVEALLTAIGRFDPSKGTSLGTYALHYVRGATIKFMKHELKWLGMDSFGGLEELREDCITWSQTSAESSTVPDMDTLIAVRHWVEQQTETCQRLLYLHFYKGMPLAAVARSEGVSRAATSQRLSRALKRARVDLVSLSIN